MRDSVSFYLNGSKKEVKGENIFLPFSSYLRYEARLTGTKVVCAEGDCGACTVLGAKNKENSFVSFNSCIAMTFAMDGMNLVTIEGLGAPEAPSEIQCSMVRNFGGQCGFCTPGFVMSIANMYEQKSAPTEQNAKNYLTGNLCRCTGYTPIIQAALDVDMEKLKSLNSRYPFLSQDEQPILVRTEACEFFAPTGLQEASQYKARYPEAIIFSGATDLGVQINKGKLRPKKILSLHLIKELSVQQLSGDTVEIGARVTLSEVQKLIQTRIPSFDNFLNIFASPQIKNVATLAGNLANASPIADTIPVLLALDAELEVYGKNGKTTKALRDFYLGYKKINLQSDELITKVSFKIPSPKNKVENYKVSQRRDLDISTVNASFNFTMDGPKIKSARMALGGVAATSLRLPAVEKQIEGLSLPQDLGLIKKMISDSIKPLSDMRGTAQYRTLVAGNLFEKYMKEHLLV